MHTNYFLLTKRKKNRPLKKTTLGANVAKPGLIKKKQTDFNDQFIKKIIGCG